MLVLTPKKQDKPENLQNNKKTQLSKLAIFITEFLLDVYKVQIYDQNHAMSISHRSLKF